MHDLSRSSARLLAAASILVIVATASQVTTAAASGGASLSTILTGYNRPVLVTAPRGPGHRIYIVDQTGTIEVATRSHGHWRKTGTFLDLRDRVLYDGAERGLLGLAFAPDYATSRRFYVDYIRRSDGATVVAEFHRSAKHAARERRDTFRQVIAIPQPYSNHKGGMIAFGPDRMLYIGMGDGGGEGDPQGRAQDLGSRLGKILRIDPRDPDGRGPRHYRVPRDNPYVGVRGAKPEIWARGLRNPWRWSFDRVTGDLWIGDVGQGSWEEIDVGRANRHGRNAAKGANFGWDRCEGTHPYQGTKDCATFGARPIRQYDHSQGCAVTGGYVYRGKAQRAWRGRYVYADYCGGRLWVTSNRGSIIGARSGIDTGRNISSFGEDGAGRLFAIDLGGAILRVRFHGTP